jgi:hypothetical protein
MFIHSVGGGTCAVFDVVGFDMILMTKVQFFFLLSPAVSLICWLFFFCVRFLLLALLLVLRGLCPLPLLVRSSLSATLSARCISST